MKKIRLLSIMALALVSTLMVTGCPLDEDQDAYDRPDVTRVDAGGDVIINGDGTVGNKDVPPAPVVEPEPVEENPFE